MSRHSFPTETGMDMFTLLHLVGIARDLAANKGDPARYDLLEAHILRLQAHELRDEITDLGAMIFTECLEQDFWKVYAWIFKYVRDPDPMGTRMTYLLRYAPNDDGNIFFFSDELSRQMENVRQADKKTVIAEITTAIRMAKEKR